ncbi:DNA topoisomerase III [Bacillus sonorensis]|uniref:type IA DNA topoisomerase n=1 Tax=Bacillus subtilis group TaxID=653685 RepID=UPI001FD71D04|nr:type IA DNA topoisomerase [Bacillus sonorensis]MCJ8223709.1 DNA topoisomerase III [Bacillus paralicheniformis]MEC0526228.1 DNA topoisomerase III [Bacillus sonorensis]
MTTLILAEKYQQAKAYKSIFQKTEQKKGFITVKDDLFPNGAIITWGVGHLVELEEPKAYGEKYAVWNLNNLPLLPKPSEFKKRVIEKTKDQYKVVKSLLDKCDEIIIATDSGREGELIAYSIIEMAQAGHKPIKRMWAEQLVESKLRDAFSNLRKKEETYGYFVEAQTRQYADWIVGMNGSPLISILINNYSGFPKFEVFSLGRVQTPTLFMVYELDKKIDSFVSTPFFELEGIAETESGTFSVSLKDKKKFPSMDELNMFLADKGLKKGKNSGRIKSVHTEKKEQSAPSLFNLTDLQKEAGKRYGFTAKKVLSVLQTLYDNGYVTYPRTDSKHIGQDEFKDILKCRSDVAETLDINVEWVTDEARKKYVDDSKVEEHSALMVTKKTPDYEELSEDQKIIYSLIAISNLRMFLGEYVYNITKVTVSIRDVEFVASGRTDLDLGWKTLNNYLVPSNKNKKNSKKETEANKDEEKKLPILFDKMPVDVNLKTHSGKTKPPQRMTESRLLELMENPNVENESDKAVLKKSSGIGTVATRADIIERLKELNYITTEKGKLMTTEKGKILCEAIEGTLLSNASMTANWERYLQEIHSGRASQEVFLEKIYDYIKELIDTLPGKMEAKKSSFTHIHDSELEKQKIGTCPNCGKTIIKKELNLKKEGKNSKSVFYGCTGYDDGCKFSIPVKYCGKTLSESNVKLLINKGITKEIKGFKSKDPNKKDFSAKLKLADKTTGKLSFDFSK